MQVGLEKFALGAKLLLDFAFGPHPHVLNVLGVNFTVVQIHKMCLVDDD